MTWVPACCTAIPLTTLGLNFHFFIALKADESNTLGGLDWTTFGEETEPSGSTINFTFTHPSTPARSSFLGYWGFILTKGMTCEFPPTWGPKKAPLKSVGTDISGNSISKFGTWGGADNSGVTNSGGGGFLGGSGLSGIVLDFYFNEVSFLSLIKSTTLNEFSFFNDSELGFTIYARVIKKTIDDKKPIICPEYFLIIFSCDWNF